MNRQTARPDAFEQTDPGRPDPDKRAEAEDPTLSAFNEVNAYMAHFVETYNGICLDYVSEQGEQSLDYAAKARKQGLAHEQARLGTDFVTSAVSANLRASERMAKAVGGLMTDMMSLFTSRLK